MGRAAGSTVYPADVEAVLFEHPKVQEAAVIGLPDERTGEMIKAFIVLKEGKALQKKRSTPSAGNNWLPTRCHE